MDVLCEHRAETVHCGSVLKYLLAHRLITVHRGDQGLREYFRYRGAVLELLLSVGSDLQGDLRDVIHLLLGKNLLRTGKQPQQLLPGITKQTCTVLSV